MSLISVAECATGGNIMAKITSYEGASKYYAGGINTYRIREKVELLSVDKYEAEQFNCVSQRVAEEMAKGVSELFDTPIGISATGYASEYQTIKTPYVCCCIYIDFAKCTSELAKKINDLSPDYDEVKNYNNQKYYYKVIYNDAGFSRIEFQKYVADRLYKFISDIIN